MLLAPAVNFSGKAERFMFYYLFTYLLFIYKEDMSETVQPTDVNLGLFYAGWSNLKRITLCRKIRFYHQCSLFTLQWKIPLMYRNIK